MESLNQTHTGCAVFLHACMNRKEEKNNQIHCILLVTTIMLLSLNCSYLYLNTVKADNKDHYCLQKGGQQSGLLTYLGQSQEGLILCSHKPQFFPFPRLYTTYKFHHFLINWLLLFCKTYLRNSFLVWTSSTRQFFNSKVICLCGCKLKA